MLPDSELERPDDRVVRLHLQENVSERSVLDLEIKRWMLEMVYFPGVKVHGEARQLRKDRSEFANTCVADRNGYPRNIGGGPLKTSYGFLRSDGSSGKRLPAHIPETDGSPVVVGAKAPSGLEYLLTLQCGLVAAPHTRERALKIPR